MSYALCFICSEQIEGCFESNKNKPTTAGTLCELLQLPMRDSTFTFGQKFQETPYCTNCVKEMTEMRQLLEDLKELNKQIQKKRYHVENRLRKSCEHRRLSGENYSDEENDGEDTFHPLDHFREDVVKEINSLRNITSNTCQSPDVIEVESKPFIKREIPSSINKIVIRAGKVQNIEEPQPHSTGTTSKIRTTNTSIRPGTSSSHTYSQAHTSQYSDMTSREIRSRGVTMKHIGATCTPVMLEQTEDDELPDFESENDPLSATQFMSILSGDTPVEVQIDEQESDTDGIQSEGEEIFVDATSDGRFQCPYAPNCQEVFEPTEFLNHVRIAHNVIGKPYQGSATPMKKPRSGYDIQFKLEAVAFAEEHCNAAAARQFCVDSKCIRTWKKQKSHLEAALDKRTKTPSAVRRRLPGAGRKPAAPNLSNPVIVIDPE